MAQLRIRATNADIKTRMKLVSLKSLRLHPEANRVPRMPPEQDADFRADIAERGVRVPIEIMAGRVIVDGRSRYLAAKRLGIQRVPVIRAPLNGDDPVIYMLRAATKRRHLTDDQRACLAREEREILRRIVTRGRSRLGGLTGGHGQAEPSDRLPNTSVAKQSGSGGTVGGTEIFSVHDTFVSRTSVKTKPSRQPLANRHGCS